MLSLILALSCTAALLGGCAGNNTSDDNTASGEHEVIKVFNQGKKSYARLTNKVKANAQY